LVAHLVIAKEDHLALMETVPDLVTVMDTVEAHVVVMRRVELQLISSRLSKEVVVGLVLAVVQAVTVQQHHLVQGSLEKFVVILRRWKDSFVFCSSSVCVMQIWNL